MVEGLARTGETCGIPQVKMLVADQLEDIGWQREQAKDKTMGAMEASVDRLAQDAQHEAYASASDGSTVQARVPPPPPQRPGIMS